MMLAIPTAKEFHEKGLQRADMSAALCRGTIVIGEATSDHLKEFCQTMLLDHVKDNQVIQWRNVKKSSKKYSRDPTSMRR